AATWSRCQPTQPPDAASESVRWPPDDSEQRLQRRANQGADLQDVARIFLDEQVRHAALGSQLGSRSTPVAADIDLNVDLWLVGRRRQTLRWIHDAGGTGLTLDDLDLVAEHLLAACARS